VGIKAVRWGWKRNVEVISAFMTLSLVTQLSVVGWGRTQKCVGGFELSGTRKISDRGIDSRAHKP